MAENDGSFPAFTAKTPAFGPLKKAPPRIDVLGSDVTPAPPDLQFDREPVLDGRNVLPTLQSVDPLSVPGSGVPPFVRVPCCLRGVTSAVTM